MDLFFLLPASKCTNAQNSASPSLSSSLFSLSSHSPTPPLPLSCWSRKHAQPATSWWKCSIEPTWGYTAVVCARTLLNINLLLTIHVLFPYFAGEIFNRFIPDTYGNRLAKEKKSTIPLELRQFSFLTKSYLSPLKILST